MDSIWLETKTSPNMIGPKPSLTQSAMLLTSPSLMSKTKLLEFQFLKKVYLTSLLTPFTSAVVSQRMLIMLLLLKSIPIVLKKELLTTNATELKLLSWSEDSTSCGLKLKKSMCLLMRLNRLKMNDLALGYEENKSNFIVSNTLCIITI